MRVHGYCEKCHKIRPVYVSGSALQRSIATNSVTVGVCFDCEYGQGIHDYYKRCAEENRDSGD